MTRRSYDIDSPEYSEMSSNQRLFGIVLIMLLSILIVGGIVGTCAYFWGELGAKIAFIAIGALLLIVLSWTIVMVSINRVSYIYRDAADTIINFQAADDRGEVMRHLSTVVKSGNQLDSNVLRLAGSMAKNQANAIIQAERRQIPEAQTVDVWDSDSDEDFPGW